MISYANNSVKSQGMIKERHTIIIITIKDVLLIDNMLFLNNKQCMNFGK